MPSTSMPRAKRERLVRVYQRMRARIAYDLVRNNADRLGVRAELQAAYYHLDRRNKLVRLNANGKRLLATITTTME